MTHEAEGRYRVGIIRGASVIAIGVVLVLCVAGGAAAAAAGKWVVETRQAANADVECQRRSGSGGNTFTDGWAERKAGRYSCVFRTSAGNLAHGIARAVTVLAGIAGALCMAVVLLKLLGPPRPRSGPLAQ